MIVEEYVQCILWSRSVHSEISPNWRSGRRKGSLRMFGTVEWLGLLTFQRSNQTSILFNFTVPYESSRRDFISRSNKHPQQKTDTTQDTYDHDNRCLREPCSRLHYRSNSRQGRLWNNSLLHRTHLTNGTHPEKSWRGGRKLFDVAGNQ